MRLTLGRSIPDERGIKKRNESCPRPRILSRAPAGLGRSLGFINWYEYEFWRFVLAQQIVGQYAQSFIEFPPMQKGASFNLEQLKEELQRKASQQNQ